MDQSPLDELAQLFAELGFQQGSGVDLCIGTGGYPVVQQGGILQHIGVALDMRDQRHDALLLQIVQGLPDKMRLVGGGEFQQQIGGISHAQRPGVQLAQTGREEHLCPQLEIKLHGLPFQRSSQLFKGSLPLFCKGFYRGALAVEVAGERNIVHTVLVFPAQQLQRDCCILCAVIDAGQNVTMQIGHNNASLYPACRRHNCSCKHSCMRSWSP